MITEPKVTLWARSVITSEMLNTLPADGFGTSTVSSDLLAEAAGRTCYQSFHRPNSATARTADYVRHILEIQHESVLAHASATFYIEGISRSLSLELVRSRFLAFSQVSQRYVDSKDLDWVCPPALLDSESAQDLMNKQFQDAVSLYEYLMHDVRSVGAPRKQAREAARAALPNMAETKIVVSGNMRAWRDFLKLRLSEGADAEIQRLAHVLLHKLRDLAPATFSDFKEL